MARARKIELSLGDGYWHPWVFEDLRPGDVFRFRDDKYKHIKVFGLPGQYKPGNDDAWEVISKEIRDVTPWWLRRWRGLMATIKKGLTEQAREWWKHLRPFGKRDFWKRQRRADKAKLREEP